MNESSEHPGRAAQGRIELAASMERVWRALTEAAELERWFPLEAEVEPGPGGRIWMSWGGEHAGWSDVLVWDPPGHLRVSWSWGEGEAQVTDYRLSAAEGRVLLRVVTSGFPADATWDDLVEGTRLGWLFELRQLKHYLERHAGEARRAVYVRRRVALSRGEAWARLMGPDGAALANRTEEVFDRTPSWQYAAVTADPPDGLLRLTIDPTHVDPGARDVSVWICAWGDARGRVPAVAGEWRSLLARLFPDGTELAADA